MAINFCSARLKTKIYSSAVSCEGYDVANLLSGGSLLQSNGFLAEGFTKPPVSIYLKFSCHVDINHIVLWVEVGRQKTNGLELIAAADSKIYDDKTERDTPVLNSSSCVVKVGSCKVNCELGVVFQKYKDRLSPIVPSNFLVKHFNTSAANVLRNCSDLEIKIFSTSNSSVPSMKKIEVWGQPGSYCPENVKLNICKLWDQPTENAKSVPVKVNLPIEINNKSGTSSTSNCSCDPVVPEEFLDPITLNIMAIPMALPSGKAVDLSTLEKFEAAEAVWGRSPSDPFTGVPFTQSNFPVPDIALKSRIDLFLIENGHLAQFKGVGRTIGHHKHNLNKFSESLRKCRQISNVGGKQTSDCGVSSSRSLTRSLSSQSPLSCLKSPVSEECHSKPSLLGAILDENTSSVVQQPEGSITKVHCGLKRKNEGDYSPALGDLQKCGKESHMKNHEDTVEDSLDCALQSVLTGLPSFVKTTAHSLKESIDQANNSECSHCLTEDCLYTLPCKHLLCRSCLVTKSTGNKGKMECEMCHNQYYSSDVIRFHK